MELIEQLNIIEVVLLAGIWGNALLLGLMINSKLNKIERGLAFARFSESKEDIPMPILEVAKTTPMHIKVDIPKPPPIQEVSIQEQLKKVIPRTEPISAKGTCDWCGNEYSNLPVHRRFCKTKPPAT